MFLKKYERVNGGEPFLVLSEKEIKNIISENAEYLKTEIGIAYTSEKYSHIELPNFFNMTLIKSGSNKGEILCSFGRQMTAEGNTLGQKETVHNLYKFMWKQKKISR